MIKLFSGPDLREEKRSIVPLIMCGGAGTRLWPASREVRPKQFLPLFGPRSTFQDTMRRDSGPAIAAGAVFAQMRDGDAVVLALAADHIVRDTDAFVAACRHGLVAADAGKIVTFGVSPERAAT